jgi:hypothetical protein
MEHPGERPSRVFRMRATAVSVQKATVGPFLFREAIRYRAIREEECGRCPRK